MLTMYRLAALIAALGVTIHLTSGLLGFDGIIDAGTIFTDSVIGVLPPRYPQMSASDEWASKRAFLLSEHLRQIMPTGVFTVPPLDPYYRETLGPFKVMSYSPIKEGSIGLTNAVIRGMKDFKLNGIELRQGYTDNAFRADLNVTIPLVRFQAEFNGMLTLETIIAHVHLD